VVSSVVSAENAGGRVLLVVASPTLDRNLSEMLPEAGYQVQFAAEQFEWRRTLTGFDIAILVISTPFWFSGTIFGICAVIRHDLPNVPIIVVGPNNVEAKIRLLEIGADDYVTDPFDPREFLARVRALIRRHKQRT